jgi:hypothetical protein
LLTLPSTDGRFKEEVQWIDHEDCDQHETSFPIYINELVRDEHPIEILLQLEEHLLVQTKDDFPHSMVMISQPTFVLQCDPQFDHCLDIRLYHDPVEMRMLEVFQEAMQKSFSFSTFFLFTSEQSCSDFS